MNRVAKVALSVVVAVVALACAALAVLFLRYPAVGPAPEITVAGTPEQVARGRYLANHVTVCLDCHSPRDWSRFSAPPLASGLGHGDEGLTRAQGFPGEVPAPDITPAALAEWSDGELVRAITSGLRRDGEPLFPFMPYLIYGALSQEDVAAIVAYLRTLPRGSGARAPRELDFPLSLIVRTMPREAALRERSPRPGEGGYGEYLVAISGCRFCHTPQDGSDEQAFGGGHEFPLPSGVVVSPNITPDLETGIGGWTKETFVARFKAFAAGAPAVAAGEPNTVMPWTMYAGMTEEDLGAIYDHLRTVPAIEHRVEKWPALVRP